MTGFLRLLRCTRGAAAVEFAIISVVFVGLLIAIVDFGRTLYIKNQLSFLADQATRTMLITPSTADATIINTIGTDFNAGDAAQLNVTITYETIGSNDFRVLTIDYPMTLFVPNLASDAINLSVMRRVPDES